MLLTKFGMTNLNHLTERMKKRDVTVKHINNTFHLIILGKTKMLDS